MWPGDPISLTSSFAALLVHLAPATWPSFPFLQCAEFFPPQDLAVASSLLEYSPYVSPPGLLLFVMQVPGQISPLKTSQSKVATWSFPATLCCSVFVRARMGAWVELACVCLSVCFLFWPGIYTPGGQGDLGSALIIAVLHSAPTVSAKEIFVKKMNKHEWRPKETGLYWWLSRAWWILGLFPPVCCSPSWMQEIKPRCCWSGSWIQL